MTLTVIRPGIQATLQGAPRHGSRHLGVPASGPADPLSMALANRLVGNPADACAIEFPLGLTEFRFDQEGAIAIAGAPARIGLNGTEVAMHRTIPVRAGDQVSIGSPEAGARLYLAAAGGFVADTFLESVSTCLPAGFGGYAGHPLRAGDSVGIVGSPTPPASIETPSDMRQTFVHSYALRCVAGPDAAMIPGLSADQEFTATRRADRMGIEVAGPWPEPGDAGLKPSAPVFPGAVQLTPSGNAFVLLPDSQTTGGYPHILQVIQADRHLLGQIRPGDRLRFLKRTPDEAAEDLRRKTAWFRGWLPDFRF